MIPYRWNCGISQNQRICICICICATVVCSNKLSVMVVARSSIYAIRSVNWCEKFAGTETVSINHSRFVKNNDSFPWKLCEVVLTTNMRLITLNGMHYEGRSSSFISIFIKIYMYLYLAAICISVPLKNPQNSSLKAPAPSFVTLRLDLESCWPQVLRDLLPILKIFSRFLWFQIDSRLPTDLSLSRNNKLGDSRVRECPWRLHRPPLTSRCSYWRRMRRNKTAEPDRIALAALFLLSSDLALICLEGHGYRKRNYALWVLVVGF